MLSGLLLNYSLGIPPRVIRALNGHDSESVCHAAMRYIVLGQRWVLPTDLALCFPSCQRPSFWEIRELAGKDRLHTTGDGIILLVRDLTPPLLDSQRPVGRAACLLNSKPVRVFACRCSCALGPCKLAIRRLLVTSVRRELC